MFICDKCGKQVESLIKKTEYIQMDGYSYPVQEVEIDSCSCGGEYQEAIKCPICGEWFVEDVHDCCEKCFNENLTKEICVGIGYSSFDINDFFKFVFSDTEINEILEREFDGIDASLKSNLYREYAEETYNFGEKVAERKRYENLHKRQN